MNACYIPDTRNNPNLAIPNRYVQQPFRHNAMNLAKFPRNRELRTEQHKEHFAHAKKEPFVTLKSETGSLLILWTKL